MPKHSEVDDVYEALRRRGYGKGKAARIAQSRTGEALATGRPPKHHVATSNDSLSPGNKILADLRRKAGMPRALPIYAQNPPAPPKPSQPPKAP